MKPTPECRPHPREREKRAEMERESAGKVDVVDHPGGRWWLCQPCGTWHRGQPPKEAR